MANEQKQSRWAVPSKRAKGYAEELKTKKHTRGSKKDKDLTDYEAGLRAGYLQCQNDHSSMFKYKKSKSNK